MSFVTIVTMASASAGSSMGMSPDESLVSPKNTKNVAAKRSRNGVSTWLAFAATLPDRAMPTRNAPTAADTPTCAARPATSIVRPSTPSSSGSYWSAGNRRDTMCPCRSAT